MPQETIGKIRTRRFGNLNGVAVKGKLTFIDLRDVGGVITDLVFKTTGSNFSILVKLDDEEIVNNTFAEISAVSELQSFSAGQEGNVFTLAAGDLSFTRSALVEIICDDLRFQTLYALVDTFEQATRE